MTLSTAIIDSGKILIQFIWDLLYFPFWWYARGFLGILNWALRFLNYQLSSTGLLVWVMNLFTPMFGQRDWAGIMISFFMRCIQIIARGVIMVFWLVYVLAIVSLWLIAPVYILYQLVVQLTLS